jgi:hypothetical protein
MIPEADPLKKSRWSRTFAATHIEALQQSGLSKKAYADREGIDYARLVWWSRQLKNETKSDAIDFIPVSVRSDGVSSDDAIDIIVRSGHIAMLLG